MSDQYQKWSKYDNGKALGSQFVNKNNFKYNHRSSQMKYTYKSYIMRMYYLKTESLPLFNTATITFR